VVVLSIAQKLSLWVFYRRRIYPCSNHSFKNNKNLRILWLFSSL